MKIKDDRPKYIVISLSRAFYLGAVGNNRYLVTNLKFARVAFD